ncbi:MAG TPA: ABC transporter substrate-binding protein [Chloroflexota bacterium]|nr:ABC transporter substrate-binding protein [Chloroflexota bacterium]
MRARIRLQSAVGLVVVVMLTACQQSALTRPGAAEKNPSAPSAASAPIRVIAVIMGDPPHFEGRFNPNLGSVPGLDTLEEMVNAGMANFNQNGELRPQLATEVPSLDNELWKLLPDGRMETTWKIRPGAVWHDGSPFTADDLQFTVALGQDSDLAGFGNAIYPLIESTAVRDASTFVTTWTGPFVGADTLFTRTRGLPLPKHILEGPYTKDKTSFRDLPYWSDEFVGTGPYKLRELVRGSHAIFDANDAYVLGRPKIDVVEVKFAPDANTMITTLLSGAAEITFGARISIDQALQIQDSWSDGSVIFNPGGWLVAMPQFIDPTPRLLLDVRLRRALLHAINRQVIVDDLLYGKTQIDEAPISPVDKDFKDVQSAIVHYPYDPDRVTQLMTELGYTRGSGGMFLDTSGSRLTIEARTNNQLDTQVKAAEIVTDMWKKAGFDINEVVYGQQRVADREYRNTRPAFEILGFNLPAESFALYHSREIPTADRNWFGQNRTRYSNPDYDALVDEYFVTIPRPARMDVLRKIIHLYTDQLVLLPLAYTTNHVAVGNRFKNVTGRGTDNTEGWNAEQWEYSK